MHRLYPLSMCIALAACTQQTASEESPTSNDHQNTIITGKVSQELLDKGTKYLIMHMKENHVVSDDQKEIPIDSTGKFEFTYDKGFSQMMFFQAGEVAEGLYVEPGKKMELQISEDTVMYLKDLSQINNEYRQYVQKVSFSPYLPLLSGPSMKEQGIDAYVAAMQKVQHETMQYMDSLKGAGAICDRTYELLNYSEQFGYLNLSRQMAHHQWVSPKGVAKHIYDLVKNYKGSLESIDLQREFSSAFSHLEATALAADTTKKYIELADTVINMIGNSFSEEMAQIVYQGYFSAWLSRRNWDEVKILVPYFSKYVKNEEARDKLIERAIEIETRTVTPEVYSKDLLDKLYNDPQVSDVARKIFEENKGKVVYLDICGQYCGYCLKEFPLVKEMQEKVGNPDQIAYVYLVTDSPQEKFEAAVKAYAGKNTVLDGQKYFISREQAQRLFSIIKSQGIPRYMMINKKGVIVEAYAPRPSSDATVGMLKKLINQ